nr:DUF4253 domain-containing protein [Streptomyces sp. SBE_14.2]
MTVEARLCRVSGLPPGRVITSYESVGDARPLWLSDAPATAELWSRLRRQHPVTGLWPLLLEALDPLDEDFRPWGCGELYPQGTSSSVDHRAETLLADWWREYTSVDEDDDHLTAEERLAVTAPFGRAWPGLSPTSAPDTDPEEMAEEYAKVFLAGHPHARLGLVEALRGADALTAVGWSGPANYGDTAKFSAIVRSWEDRFGARVVAVGFDTLHLSVAAPPRRQEDALPVAAEHFAFCPDTVWQGAHDGLASCAETLVGLNCWEFWWD